MGLEPLLPPAFTLLGWGPRQSTVASLPTSFRTLLNVTGTVPWPRCLYFFNLYINIILANRNSFKCLASRRALPLFQGLMQFFSLFVYSIGHFQDYKENSICLCSQCHIACKKNYPHILTQIKQNDAIF